MKLLLLLAQIAPAPPQDRGKLLVALFILLALVFVGGFGILLLRRKLYSSRDEPPEVGFSLSDLRKMRDRGEITPEEYEITRNKVIAKVKSSMEAKPKPTTPLPPPGELEEE